MHSQDNVIAFDLSRTRKGMRSLVLEMVIEISCLQNLSRWNSLPQSHRDHVTAAKISSCLGSVADFSRMNDSTAAERAARMSILVLHAVHSGQYHDQKILKRALEIQSRAQKILERIAQRAARERAEQTVAS